MVGISRIYKEDSFVSSDTEKHFYGTQKQRLERRTINDRLLFTDPVSNAKLERMFSKLKRVKTNFGCSLGVIRLEHILRIMEEGSSWETFDPVSAIKK